MLRAIDHHGSVSEAARVMHLTPSAVSQQVRHLATEAGTPLLERRGRTVRLTPAARTLLGYAHQVVALWETTRAALDATGRQLAGELAVCSFATAIPTLVAPVAAALTADNHDVRITVREASTADSLTELLHHDADIAVVPAPNNPPLDDPRFDQQPLLDDPQDLIVASDSPLASRDQVRLQDLSSATWIEPHRDQRQLIEASCAMEGFTPQFSHHADDWNAALGLVQAGLGVCLYPRLAPLTTTGVRRIQLAGPRQPVRRIQVCTRAGSGQLPLIAEVLRQLALETKVPVSQNVPTTPVTDI